jgi:uncharacterized protein
LSEPLRKIALVTGASAGLGVEFARQLAARGMDLAITARRIERLEKLAGELSQRYGVNVEPLPADLSRLEDLHRLEQWMAQTDRLDLLVNNAGYGLVGNFWEMDRDAQGNMLAVHATASTRLTHAALQGMVARRHGGVIEVASLAAFLPGRKSVMYNASKAYLVAFVRSLQTELNRSGVHVQALCPGFIRTEFHDTPELEGFDRSKFPGWLWLNAHDVVAKSLTEIRRGSGVVIPSLRYRVAGVFAQTLLGGWLLYKAVGTK